MPVDIIVPVWNHWAWTEKCLAALREHTDRDAYRLMLIDNGSDEDTAARLRRSIEAPDILVRWPVNQGFIKAANYGFSHTDGDVILLNNDCIVRHGWLDPLLTANADMVSPVNNKSKTLQNVAHIREHLCDPDIPPVKNEDRKCDDYMRKHYGGVVLNAKKLAFFCVLIKRHVIDAVGLLDEAFGLGECDDRDYCIRVEEAGMTMGVALDSVVFHEGHVSFWDIPLCERFRGMNIKVLKEKYPDYDWKAM